jgi:acyl-CoA hydrolase
MPRSAPKSRATDSFPFAQKSEARMVHVVFPEDTNHYGTLFGGTALAWMDHAAFVAATRCCRKSVVTVASERMNFKVPVHVGSIVELVANVVKVGRSSLEVRVELFVEDAFRGTQKLCARGRFTLVAVNKQGRPIAALRKRARARTKKTR